MLSGLLANQQPVRLDRAITMFLSPMDSHNVCYTYYKFLLKLNGFKSFPAHGDIQRGRRASSGPRKNRSSSRFCGIAGAAGHPDTKPAPCESLWPARGM